MSLVSSQVLSPSGSVNTAYTAQKSHAHTQGCRICVLTHLAGAPTCAGVPGLNEPPDDGVAPVTRLLDTLALLLVETVLQEDSDVGFVLIGVLERVPRRGHM